MTKIPEEMYEVELYFLIEECGAFMWRISHDMPDQDITDVRKQQVKTLHILDNVYGEGKFFKEEKLTGEYWGWYDKWNGWHNGMSVKRWREIDYMLTAGKMSEEISNDLRDEAFNFRGDE